MYHEARVTKCPIFDRTCGSEELVHESEARHRPEGVLTVSELGGELARSLVAALRLMEACGRRAHVSPQQRNTA